MHTDTGVELTGVNNLAANSSLYSCRDLNCSADSSIFGVLSKSNRSSSALLLILSEEGIMGLLYALMDVTTTSSQMLPVQGLVIFPLVQAG
jgi:hypothetical protein